ncbi:uncharacterized protein LOC143222808 isoform X2 [Tachypleus tridentatus]|uniref:uncharacterized protein LOC143222808 isoform X2 n=1 Tax=Tachypleus tridentatus TaxID=6853 RepID=UPI003FD49F5E
MVFGEHFDCLLVRVIRTNCLTVSVVCHLVDKLYSSLRTRKQPYDKVKVRAVASKLPKVISSVKHAESFEVIFLGILQDMWR